ncbi:MAG: hypothetical protein J6A52_06445 [Bacilli bacterium]|nr:hypothetical protein [Bacilli bacterium]
MNSELNIDSSKLALEIEKLRKVSKDLEDILNKLKNENSILYDNWETRTSEQVFFDFDMFYKELETIKKTNDNDANFLQNVVNNSYVQFETNTNKLVDNNIAI